MKRNSVHLNPHWLGIWRDLVSIFQMSFAAVVALVAAYELLREPLAGWGRNAGLARKVVLYLAGIALSSLVAGIATTPYALYHFDRFSTYSLAANLIAVPITGLWIMPWAVVSFGLMPFGLERFGLIPMGWGVDWMLQVGRTVSHWPGAAVSLPAMPTIGLLAVSAGGIWLCLWQAKWRLLGVPVIAAGLATTWLVPRPDILVSDDAGYMAVRAEGGGMWVSSARGNFTTDTWLRPDGLEQGQRWPAIGSASGDGRLRCDRWGCLYRADGRVVALVQEEEALAEDCRTADVVIAAVAVFVPCPAKVVIDRLDVWREGAHAVWLHDDGEIRVESVADTRGQRPWVLRRPPPD